MRAPPLVVCHSLLKVQKNDLNLTLSHLYASCHSLYRFFFWRRPLETQRPGLHVSSMSGAKKVLCLEIMPSELGFSLQFFLINQHLCCCDTVTGIHKEYLDPFLTNDIISDLIRDWTLTFNFQKYLLKNTFENKTKYFRLWLYDYKCIALTLL